MAEETDSLGGFNIVETSNIGSTALLDSLYETESVTTKSEDIKDIKDEKKKTSPTTPPPAKKKEDQDPDKEKKPDPLKSFLNPDKEEGESEEEEEPKGEEEETEETPESNQFTALARDLVELGVFSKEEGEEIEINSPQEFLDRFTQEKKKGANEMIERFISQFGEDYQQAFEAIYIKGVDPKEYFTTYGEIENIASLDLKEENNQIAVIRKALSNQGWETEEITEEIDKLKGYGELETTATRHHKGLIKTEASRLERLQQESQQRVQQEQAVKTQYQKNVQTVIENKLKAKEFDGIPLNPQLATELRDFLVTDKYKTPSGELLTEFDKTVLDLKRPENHEKKVKVALLLKVLEKDPTLSTIQKAGVTKKTDQLFNEVLKHKTPAKTEKTVKEKTTNSWFK
jgi:hypothetical protein